MSIVTVDASAILRATPFPAFTRADALGYSFAYQFEEGDTMLVVFASRGEVEGCGIAHFHWEHREGGGPAFCCFDVQVDPPHQRQGLATTMYVLAERVTGLKLENTRGGGDQTDDGYALWHQRGRQFGQAPP